MKNKKMFLKLFLVAFAGILVFIGFSYISSAAVTISGTGILGDSSFNSISGVVNTNIDLGSGHTLLLQTTNNGPVTIGTGLVTLGGNLTISGLASSGTQCLQVSSTGAVSGTGAACGGGASVAPVSVSFNDGTSTCSVTSGSGSCTASGSGLVITHNLNTIQPVIVCYDGSGNMLGSTGASTSVSSIVATSANIATLTFSGATTGTCMVSTGGSAPVTLTQLPSPDKIRTCTVTVGNPGAASPVLANDNDSPVACGNSWGSDWTIQSVSCYADAGSPTVQTKLTGGSATSILTGDITCGSGAWAAGTVQGTAPVVHSFSANGATCSSTPCTLDANITTAGGTAKYIIMRITGTL